MWSQLATPSEKWDFKDNLILKLKQDKISVGESSGKASRTVAKHIPGPASGLDQLGVRASTAASEVSRAHQMVVERGDKLSQLEDRTERMHSQAAEFSSSAHQLMLKYKDKKWYQLWSVPRTPVAVLYMSVCIV